MLYWAQEHTEPEQWEMVEQAIFEPYYRPGIDADNVDQSVVDEEMSLFNAFAGQNKALGG